MQPSQRDTHGSLSELTPRESELLKKAGERVFALSRRLPEKEREASRYQSELQGLRELLAESREVRQVLSSQVTSLQTELDREYEERSELRRLLGSLHLQMQELLPLVTGLNRQKEALAVEAPSLKPNHPAPKREAPRNRSIASRLFAAADELRGGAGQKRRR